ncbi:MAG TPA: glycosyltransferase [Candidatus Acidoferrales bacterium]|nr:glycosyltransferase [Candidatus Acidoferrales bacterium]
MRDYCLQLSQAFARRGEHLDVVEVRWETQGWLRSSGQLWRESQAWKGKWVLLQYTSLMWSRRGFPLGALAVLVILRMRGAKVCMVFHDIRNDQAHGWKNRLRVAYQYQVMRRAYTWATRSVLTVPAKNVPWLRRSADRATFIPVGSNFPESELQNLDSSPRSASILTVAVFGVTDGSRSCHESADISYVIRQAMSSVASLRLVVMGRGAAEAEATLRKDLEGSGVVLTVLGVLPPEQIQRQFLMADVLLCVRGHISTRRGSAIAGIACGLPVVGYRGEETAFPITEAGVLLADPGDRVGVAEALKRVLCDAKFRDEMHQRSLLAEQKYFSWDAIAEQFLLLLTSC